MNMQIHTESKTKTNQNTRDILPVLELGKEKYYTGTFFHLNYAHIYSYDPLPHSLILVKLEFYFIFKSLLNVFKIFYFIKNPLSFSACAVSFSLPEIISVSLQQNLPYPTFLIWINQKLFVVSFLVYINLQLCSIIWRFKRGTAWALSLESLEETSRSWDANRTLKIWGGILLGK